MDYKEIPLHATRQKTCTILSTLLNPTKVLMSKEGMHRDWRGIANLVGFSKPEAIVLPNNDPMAKLLSLWRRDHNQTANFDNLLKFLGNIDRWDVVDDLTKSLAEDAQAFLLNKSQQISLPCNDIPKDVCRNLTLENLTIHDADNAYMGLPIQKYDAFVLFADEDYKFAEELIRRLKEEDPKFGFTVCYKDLLLAGVFEHSAMCELISQRCKRLVVIFTKAFLNSSVNVHFTSFAVALQIEQRKRLIVPCLYENCVLPFELRFCSSLKYYHSTTLINFWDKLSSSIRYSPNGSMTNIQNDVVQEEQQQIATTSSAPVKIARQKASSVSEPIDLLPESLPSMSSSMNQLDSLAAHDNNANYLIVCDLSSNESSDIIATELFSSKKSRKRAKSILSKCFVPFRKLKSKSMTPAA